MLITIWRRKYIAFASFYSSFNSALRNDNIISVWHKATETSLMIRVNCCLRLATIVVSLLSVSCSTANRLPTSWTRLFLPVKGHFLCQLLCSPDLWRQFDSAKLDSDYSESLSYVHLWYSNRDRAVLDSVLKEIHSCLFFIIFTPTSVLFFKQLNKNFNQTNLHNHGPPSMRISTSLNRSENGYQMDAALLGLVFKAVCHTRVGSFAEAGVQK